MQWKSKLNRALKNEKGIAIIEYVMILALVGLIVASLGPMTKSFFVGNEATGKVGFSQKIIASSLNGVDESKDGVKIVEGCIANPPHITQEECDAVL